MRNIVVSGVLVVSALLISVLVTDRSRQGPVASVRPSSAGSPGGDGMHQAQAGDPVDGARTPVIEGPPERPAARPASRRRSLQVEVHSDGLARVDFELLGSAPGPGELLLLRESTDDTGVRMVELSRESIEFGSNGVPVLHARVVEPGLQQRLRRLVGHADDGVWTLNLHIQPGATARGRVVDSEGRGVKALVQVLRERAGERPGWAGASVHVSDDGRFEVSFTEPVVDGILFADGSESGTAALRDLELDPLDPAQDLLVTLTGPGVLRGHVLDGDGIPVPGLVLMLQLPGASPTPSLEGGGRTWGLVTTDVRGAFEVRGLRDDRYEVRALRDPRSGEYTLVLTEEPVAADGHPVLLEFLRPRLVVSLLEADGAPWSGSAHVAHNGLFERVDWPLDPQVLVRPCDGEGDAMRARSSLVRGQAIGPGKFAFELEAERTYLAGALGGSFDGVLHPVRAERLTHLELTALAQPRFGRVVVRIEREGQRAKGLWVVTLEQPGTGAVLLSRDSGAFRFRAPPGTYRIVAEGRASSSHGLELAAPTPGRVEQEVTIVPDVLQQVVLEVIPGALLEVTLVGVADDGDRKAVMEWLASRDLTAEVQQQALQSIGATLRLRRPGQDSEIVFRDVDGMRSYSWTLGDSHISRELPAGQGELVATLPGGREARAEVALRSGETTRVELRF